MQAQLRVLQEQIERRCEAIAETYAGVWPCRKGCGFCCTRLASIPILTRAEWDLLEAGLARLPAATRQQAAERVAGLTAGPVVCPFLDRESESCLVYAHRPIACRTYGFYVERDKGLYCGDILAMVEAGAARDVVWGNAESVDATLDRMGERRELNSWFRGR